MTTCREAKQGMRRDQDNWNGMGGDSKGQGAWENSGIGVGALLALLCCQVGLVWAQSWVVNGTKQGLGGKLLSPFPSLNSFKSDTEESNRTV